MTYSYLCQQIKDSKPCGKDSKINFGDKDLCMVCYYDELLKADLSELDRWHYENMREYWKEIERNENGKMAR